MDTANRPVNQHWSVSRDGKVRVPLLSDSFHEDVAAELVRLRAIEAAAKVFCASPADERVVAYRALRAAMPPQPVTPTTTQP